MQLYKGFGPIVLRTASGTNHPLQLDLFLSLLWQSLITQDCSSCALATDATVAQE